jgi:FRG domain
VKEQVLSSWDEFECALRKLRGDYEYKDLLFRGQGHSAWRLTTTLERAGCEDMSFEDYYGLVAGRLKPAIETFTGVEWNVFPEDAEILRAFRKDGDLLSLHHFSVELYRYMVYLRHHGLPSPLLDWTHSPFVAAFFAFRDSGSTEKRSIYAYCEMPRGLKGEWGRAPVICPMGPYVRSHPRHFRQQSSYTICGSFDPDSGWRFRSHEPVFGGGADMQDVVWKFTLPSSERVPVLSLLQDYNLNAFSLFDSEESLLETMWFREQVLRGQ